MIPWTEVGKADAPGGARLRLMQRGAEFSIMVGGDELMNSRRGGSETALGALACAHLGRRKAPHVLIGGLGMGFTLRAALGELGPNARITVAEIVPEVVSWAQGVLAGVFQQALDDPRVCVFEGDVGALITTGRASYDAIILDVDNGPGGLVRSENDRLYDHEGLIAAKRSLRTGGVLAVWSASQNATFKRRLETAGFLTTEVVARSAGSRAGARHLIWIGERPPGDA